MKKAYKLRIHYKDNVLHLFPDAVCVRAMTREPWYQVVEFSKMGRTPSVPSFRRIYGVGPSPSLAWRDAYDRTLTLHALNPQQEVINQP